uniref:hypothetical protein n=1 Tax=Acetatifactor sp. TaxID=1872090 RepID=UPI004055BC8F
MKKYFIVSLCRNGILGGGILADNHKLTYKTGKLTIPDKFRNLEMRYADMNGFSVGRLLFLPTVTIKMKDSENYKFVVFARRKFIDVLNRAGISCVS